MARGGHGGGVSLETKDGGDGGDEGGESNEAHLARPTPRHVGRGGLPNE